MKRKVLWVALIGFITLLLAISCAPVFPEEDVSTVDSDGDGWTDVQEDIAGTDPHTVDTDDDGYWDPHDPNPLDPNIPIDEDQTETTPEQTAASTPIPAKTPIAPANSAASLTFTPEAAEQELHEVQEAVEFMMRNNKLTRLANPVSVPTNDMNRFPDATTRHGTTGIGYVLYLHDFTGDGDPNINYIHSRHTKGTYICDAYGNVTPVTVGYE